MINTTTALPVNPTTTPNSGRKVSAFINGKLGKTNVAIYIYEGSDLDKLLKAGKLPMECKTLKISDVYIKLNQREEPDEEAILSAFEG